MTGQEWQAVCLTAAAFTAPQPEPLPKTNTNSQVSPKTAVSWCCKLPESCELSPLCDSVTAGFKHGQSLLLECIARACRCFNNSQILQTFCDAHYSRSDRTNAAFLLLLLLRSRFRHSLFSCVVIINVILKCTSSLCPKAQSLHNSTMSAAVLSLLEDAASNVQQRPQDDIGTDT